MSIIKLVITTLILVNFFDSNHYKCAANKIDFKKLQFYHTTDGLNKILKNLESKCNGNMIITQMGADPSIDIITIENKKSSNTEKQKAFLLYGEHSRELITTENALFLIETLCKKHNNLYKDEEIDEMLKNTIFKIIPNGNPIGRKMVEDGAYCKRGNKNLVDLNRNWDFHWKKEETIVEGLYPGSKPFSETETQTFKKLSEEFKPDVFLTVHSGVFGIYTPYAYSSQQGADNLDELNRVMNLINEKYCDCDHGAAGNEVGFMPRNLP